MTNQIWTVGLLTCFIAPIAVAQEKLPPQTKTSSGISKTQETGDENPVVPATLVQKASLLISYNLVKDMKDQEVEVDTEKMIEGIRLAAAGKKPNMSDEEILSVMQTFQRQVMRQQQARMMKLADDNNRKGAEFLKKNLLGDGVKELESGLQYKILNQGDGETPVAADRVKVHYKGSLIDGRVFETTDGGPPATFRVGGVIRGFTQALLRMKVGDKWQLFIPGDLAYGLQGNPPDIGPNQTLIFELELVEIVK